MSVRSGSRAARHSSSANLQSTSRSAAQRATCSALRRRALPAIDAIVVSLLVVVLLSPLLCISAAGRLPTSVSVWFAGLGALTCFAYGHDRAAERRPTPAREKAGKADKPGKASKKKR